MAKRTDIKKILIIGSGPIVIGQAAEFDYAGTQACLALKEEGYEVILVNSNPATIMTDTTIADKVYMEPLTFEHISKILESKKPDAIIPGMGGQTSLNIVMQLEKKGILEKYGVELLGTCSESIEIAEDRRLFKEFCESIGEPIIPSKIAYSTEEAISSAREIGYPVVLRPSFTLGGTGGGFANNEEELINICPNAFKLSVLHQVLVEKSVKGFKEIEFEVIRDFNDTVITVCGMENIEPVGVHTGDSMVVAPIMTLNNHDIEMLKYSAIKIIKRLKLEGGCNVQFALDPNSSKYYLIEVNPRVSRSSALASKASGYPIARVTAKIAVGMALEDIKIASTTAISEPSFDYVISKLPRFPFDKFKSVPNKIGTQMKSTGEVMGVGSNSEESILKSVRSLETGTYHLHMKKFDVMPNEEIIEYIKDFRSDNIYAIAELIRNGTSINDIYKITKISPFFLESIKKITDYETVLKKNIGNTKVLKHAKKMGFSDKFISKLWNMKEIEVFNLRKSNNLFPTYKVAGTRRNSSNMPYFYSTYEDGENESKLSNKKKIIVLGSGPIRIGQGVEFDYSAVHAVFTIKKLGYEAIIINNNPETVSTDYKISDKLYFEPLCIEDIMNIVEMEKPEGIIVTLGGQTALNLAQSLNERNVKIIGTSFETIENAENRKSFEKILKKLGIPMPAGEAVTNMGSGIKLANQIGYPVLVRPSYVLGGCAMEIAYNETQLKHYLKTALEVCEDKPVLIDKYIKGKEIEVDAVCDGKDVFVPGIMELVEKTGIHSGDSVSVYPAFSISEKVKKEILKYTKTLGVKMGIIGPYNVQFVVDSSENIYVIEVNPRSSRTLPFISKSTKYNLADIATQVILGKSLKELGIFNIYPKEKKHWYVKVPVFSSQKIHGLDAYLSPEMKSTGEVIGHSSILNRAFYKAFLAAGINLKNNGALLISIADKYKKESFPIIKRFYNLGFDIYALEYMAKYFSKSGIKVRSLKMIGNSSELKKIISCGIITYVINTKDMDNIKQYSDGCEIEKLAVENGITVFNSLDTVKILLDVLEKANF